MDIKENRLTLRIRQKKKTKKKSTIRTTTQINQRSTMKEKFPNTNKRLEKEKYVKDLER